MDRPPIEINVRVINVPSHTMGILIGVNNPLRNSINSQSGCSVFVDDRGGTMRLEGTVSQQDEAERLIREYISSTKKRSAPASDTLPDRSADMEADLERSVPAEDSRASTKSPGGIGLFSRDSDYQVKHPQRRYAELEDRRADYSGELVAQMKLQDVYEADEREETDSEEDDEKKK